MANLYEVEGFYGSRNRGTILVYETFRGERWYCVEGSCNINCTYDEINEGCNVERLSDIDTMSSSDGIYSARELCDFVIN
jgi:hypothetical protein